MAIYRESTPASQELGSLIQTEQLAAWVWVLGYTAVMAAISVIRYRLWLALGWDLGFFQQGLWALWHQGIRAPSTMAGYPVLADTASLVLLVLAPLRVWLGTGFLLAIQSFALGLGCWWLQKISRHLSVAPAARRLATVLYVMFPTLLAANLYDFHPDVLAVPFLFGAIWGAIRHRWVSFGVWTLLALMVKDSVAVAVAAMGIALVLRRQYWPGIATVVLGVVWLWWTTAVLIPGLSHHTMFQWTAYYGQWGATPLQGAKFLLLHPWEFLAWAAKLRNWEYLVWILAPISGLWALQRFRLSWWILPAVAILEINLLSRFPAETSPFDQYSLFAVPFLFVGLLRPGPVWERPRLKKAATGLAVLFLAVMVYHFHQTTWRAIAPNTKQLSAASQLIPPHVPVVAQNYIMPHVARRSTLYDANQLGSIPLAAGTYVLLDPKFHTGDTPPAMVTQWIGRLSHSPDAALRYHHNHVYLFEMVHALGGSAHAS